MLFADFDENEKEPRVLQCSFGWDSRVRTYDTGVKVLCVTTTPYPITRKVYHIGHGVSSYFRAGCVLL